MPEAEETRLGEPNLPPAPATHGPLSIGQPFGKRYQILQLLGAGGMGVVYQAWDQELGVAVALKVIRPEVVADPHSAGDVERRFKRELLLARQVTHRNVVRIHDLGEVDGIKYITMPFVEGTSLARALASRERLPVSEALPIARDIAEGLVAAHEAGVVHRDLKPENVMLESDGRAVIMDFGISRSAASQAAGAHKTAPAPNRTASFDASVLGAGLTMAGTIVGTVGYMAPEQARAEPVDQRADIYSFGMILRDMLLGLRQASGASAIAELIERLKRAPAPIRTVDPQLPETVERIVGRCLEPDPAARYQTTQELLADLNRLDKEGQQRPEPRRFTRRHGIAAAFALLGIVAGTWWLAQPAPPEVQPPPMSVLVADFDNLAQDPSFAGAVEQALGIALEGASFITVYPRRQAHQISAQIGSGGRIDGDAARLISRREGIKVIVAGAVEVRGSGYRVTATALDPARQAQGQEPLASASAEADSREGILRAVGSLAAQLRAQLGDKTPESERLAAAETFTAASLDAMRAYVRAQELALANRNQEALQAYEEAVTRDPNFGRAYTGMAVIYSNFKDHAKAEAYYKEAMKRADRMTEREKLRTFGAYYLLAARNYELAIQTYEDLVKKYPADDGGHGNLALAKLNIGDVQGAVTEVKQSLDIYPRNSLQRYNYAIYSMYAGDFDTAIAQTALLMKENAAFEYPYIPFALSKLSKGDVSGAREAYAALEKLSPLGASFSKVGQADLAMFLGRCLDAREALRQGIAGDLKAKNEPNLAQKYVALAEVQLALGARRPAIDAARRALKLGRHEGILFPAARVLIAAGELDEAAGVAKILENMLQRQTVAYAQLVAGELALAGGRRAAAIEAFREGQKRHDSWFSRFLLGRTYAEAGRYPEALTELQSSLNRRGEAADAFFYDMPTLRYLPPAYYWLARTQEALGLSADARKNYEQYLKLRNDSSPPDELVSDVRRRLGSL